MFENLVIYHMFYSIQSNDGLIKTKADKIRLKYYDSCRKLALAENRGRVSMIPEEGERTPLLGYENSIISRAASGFLVSFMRHQYEKAYIFFPLQEYPIHLLPASLFHLHLPGQKEEERRTQSSMVTM